MKANKVSFWVTLALAIVSLVAGIIIMILPCPIVADGNIKATYTTGQISFQGTLTNKSDKDVRITKLVIIVETSGSTIQAIDDEPFTLKAGETLDLSDYGVDSFNRPTGVSRVTVTIGIMSYDIYGGSAVPVWAVACFILAAVFVLVAISVFVTNRKKMKALTAAEQTMPQLGENAVKFDGFYSQKGEKGKAAAKSALSAIGGAASALVLGFGSFRVYGSGAAVELIVSDNGLCIVDNVNGNGTTFIEKGKFPPSEITVKKTDVTLTNTMTTEYFVFKTKKAAMTAEQLVRKLTELTTAQPEAAPAETAAADAVAVADANTETPEEK